MKTALSEFWDRFPISPNSSLWTAVLILSVLVFAASVIINAKRRLNIKAEAERPQSPASVGLLLVCTLLYMGFLTPTGRGGVSLSSLIVPALCINAVYSAYKRLYERAYPGTTPEDQIQNPPTQSREGDDSPLT